MERGKRRNTDHSGTLGWLALAAGIVAWDALAHETLSHAFARGMENVKMRPAIIGAAAITAAHLFDIIPTAIDPFDNSVELAHNFFHPVIQQITGENQSAK